MRWSLVILVVAILWVLLDERPWKIILLHNCIKLLTFNYPDPFKDPNGFALQMKNLSSWLIMEQVSELYSDQEIEVGPDYTSTIRIYKKPQLPAPAEGYPTLIWIHGGGYCIGSYKNNKDFLLEVLESWSSRGDVGQIISISYRLAPEHKFPTGVNDCLNVLKYLIEHATLFAIDTEKVFIGGESAGAALSAITSYRTKEESTNIKLAGMYLNSGSPIFNWKTSNFSRFASGYYLDAGWLHGFSVSYVNHLDDWKHPYASFNVSFEGLPPTLLHIAELDMLRDSGVEFGRLLRKANGASSVVMKIFPRVPHAWTSFFPLFRSESIEAAHHLTDWMIQQKVVASK